MCYIYYIGLTESFKPSVKLELTEHWPFVQGHSVACQNMPNYSISEISIGFTWFLWTNNQLTEFS